MVFSSENFLFVFLPMMLVLYYLFFSFPILTRNVLLLLGSLLFYAWDTSGYVFLMVLVIIFTWIYGLIISSLRESRYAGSILTVMILSYAALFIYFKYSGFLLKNVNTILGTSISVPDILLPLGISFYMFQAISYVIDVSRRTVAAQKNLLYVGLYIAFFPQLIAGPIVRYEAISEQIFHRKENFSLFATGVNKFIFGLAKKVIIANNLAIVSDYAFSMVVDRVYHGSTLMAWLGAISYMLQIFFDFSGYSDMAVGLAAMFGFHIDDNFNYPYISKSLSEFWRRWHISLQTWLNDYLYIPLGKKHTSTPLRNYLNIFIVWLFSGLWHGADWSFVLWGLYNCLFIIYEKKRGKWDIGHIYTLLVILFSWVIFRSNTTYDAFVYLAAMFGKSQYGMIDPTAVAYLQQHGIYYLSAILFSAPFIPKLALLLQQNRIWNLAYTFAQLFLLCVCIIFVLNQAYDPFIYYNF